jgi:hypothetical protein
MIVGLVQTDLLLAVGVLVAVVAIGCGLRGVHSIAAESRQQRANGSTTTLPFPIRRPKLPPADAPAEERRKAA